MPIHPDQQHLYPDDWRETSHRVREAAGWRCVCVGECGAHDGPCGARDGHPHPTTGSVVVLTVGHRDHDPTNNDDANLAAWCQRCHLLHDKAHHVAQRRRRARRELEAAGQLDMLTPPDVAK